MGEPRGLGYWWKHERTAVIIVAVLLLAGLGALLNAAGLVEDRDSSAFLACRHFRNVAADASAGILTDAELRTKLQEVYDDARLSEDRAIVEWGERMLAAVTRGDMDAFSTSVSAFGEACEPHLEE